MIDKYKNTINLQPMQFYQTSKADKNPHSPLTLEQFTKSQFIKKNVNTHSGSG
jgi:hypothetical protein